MARLGRSNASKVIDLAKTIIFIFFILKWSRKVVYYIRGHGIIGSAQAAWMEVIHKFYSVLFASPLFRPKTASQPDQSSVELEEKLVHVDIQNSRYLTLHRVGVSNGQIFRDLDKSNDLGLAAWKGKWSHVAQKRVGFSSTM